MGGTGGAPRDAGGGTAGAGGAGGATGAGTGGVKDGGAGGTGSGGAPPLGDASRPGQPRIVGYLPTYRGSYNTWATMLDWSRITHLNLAFATASGNSFTLQGQDDAAVGNLVAAAHTHGVRILISIGGSMGSDQVASLYAPGSVAGFVANLKSYLDARGLDGVDVDVEGNPVDANYGPFIDKLVAAIRPSGKLVTSALGDWFGDRVPASAYAEFDFVNVMSYDHCGSWTSACEHASYDWAMKDLTFFKNKNVPVDKIVLGVPFYGYCWGTGCPADTMTYADIIAKWPNAPDWYQAGGLSVSYNTPATIQKKAQLAKMYGGMMAWELGQDASGAASLLKTISESL